MPLLAQRRGVNLAGAEFGENTFPGTLGREYTFNSEKSFQYFSAKSLGLLRVPVRWERLQQTLRGALNQDYLNLLKTNSAWARNSGARIVIDIQNFARYKITEIKRSQQFIGGDVEAMSTGNFPDWLDKRAIRLAEAANTFLKQLT